MNALELLRDPESLPIKPVYAVYGDDAFLRREALKTIVHTALEGEDDELAIARFDGGTATLADVLDELRTLPFFSKRRVAIVDTADPFITAHRRELEGYVVNPSANGVLILCPKTWTSTTNLAKLLNEHGAPVECKPPKERELIAWLAHYCKNRFDVALDKSAAQLMLELVGPEIGLLVSELEKLTVYVGTRKSIQRDDVAKMVGSGRIETIWKVVSAVTTGQSADALDYAGGLMDAGEHPIGLLAAMSFPLLKLHHAGRLRAARVPLEEACRIAGIASFGVDQTRQQHAHLGPRRVDQLPAALAQADLDMKGASTLTPRLVLERFLVQLGLPRKD
jgi:DNA polymerase-3 subunit delta